MSGLRASRHLPCPTSAERADLQGSPLGQANSSELLAHRRAAGSHAPSAGELILGPLTSPQAPISPRPGPRMSARGLQVPTRRTPPPDRSLRLFPLRAAPAAPPPEASALRRADGRPAPGSSRDHRPPRVPARGPTTELAAFEPFGGQSQGRPPRRPDAHTWSADPEPADSWPGGIGEGVNGPGEVAAPRDSPRPDGPPRSPRPIRPHRPASRSRQRPRPEARERSPVALNLKSRAGSSLRDLRSRIHISHNSLSFLLPPASQDGE